MIVRNIVQCKLCKDIIESTGLHNYVMCSCKAIGVDGGEEYRRQVGVLEDFHFLTEKEITDYDLKQLESNNGRI